MVRFFCAIFPCKMLFTLLGWLILSVGLLACYAGLFLYEDEEGRLQNRVERLWVAIHERSSAGRTSAFFGNIAGVVTRGFNRFFGQKLISFQLVGVSTCCSFATMFLLAFVAFVAKEVGVFGPSPPLPPGVSMMRLSTTVLVTGLVFSLLAVLPSMFPSRWAVALSMIPAGFCGCGFLYMMITHLSTPPKRWSFFWALYLSLGSDILLLVLVRFTVRWVSAKTSVLRIAVTLLMQAGVVYCLVFVPFAISEAARKVMTLEEFKQSTSLMSLNEMGVLNIFTGIVSSVFLLTLIFVLLHRVTWPILSRLFYPLARYEVVRSPKIMFRMGTACVLLAVSLLHPGIVRSSAEWLVKLLKEL